MATFKMILRAGVLRCNGIKILRVGTGVGNYGDELEVTEIYHDHVAAMKGRRYRTIGRVKINAQMALRG